jgi:hypothetical protein
MSWAETIEKVSPYVVRIDTPDGGGTGFLCLYNEDRSFAGIATAAHVVSTADEWQQPIRITCPATEQVAFLDTSNRVVFRDESTDSAVILFPNNLGLPQDLIPLLPASSTLPVGMAVGWLGFPGIARDIMCFFCGTVSAIDRAHNSAYLIDGVAVNGVSGGPVIYHTPQDGATHIVGILTAYRPNRQYGEALPGLSVAQNVSHFHTVLQTIRNIDEANRKKKELEEQGAADAPVDQINEAP